MEQDIFIYFLILNEITGGAPPAYNLGRMERGGS